MPFLDIDLGALLGVVAFSNTGFFFEGGSGTIVHQPRVACAEGFVYELSLCALD